MGPHLTVEQRRLALRLKARGLLLREIGPQVGCSHQTAALIARRASRGPVRHDSWVPGPGWLTLADREEITLGVHVGESFTVIAARLGKATSTVSREVAANGGGPDTGRGGPGSGFAGPSRRSWPAPNWPAGSPAGWRSGGHRCRSRTVADRGPARSHDVGEPRNDLPGAVVESRTRIPAANGRP